jgi:hypothetical protein
MTGRIQKVNLQSPDGNIRQGFIYDQTEDRFEVLISDGNFDVIFIDRETLISTDSLFTLHFL